MYFYVLTAKLKYHTSCYGCCTFVSLLCHKSFTLTIVCCFCLQSSSFTMHRVASCWQMLCVFLSGKLPEARVFKLFMQILGTTLKRKKERDSFWGKAASGTLCGCNRILVWPIYYLQNKFMIFFKFSENWPIIFSIEGGTRRFCT